MQHFARAATCPRHAICPRVLSAQCSVARLHSVVCNTFRGVMMFKQFACSLLVVGAGCAGLDSPTEHPPAPTGTSTEPGDNGGTAETVPVVPAAPPPATAGGTWTKLATPPFSAAGFQLLLTDGTVIVSEVSTNRWWRLTPDINGSYLTGTWSQIASMPTGYAPLYFGAGVLPDGRVMVEGGEYLSGTAVWTTKGAVYNPVTNTWATVAPPAGWSSIGDASATILPDGTYMQSDCCSTKAALLNPTTMTWTLTGTGKQGASNDEESR